MAYYNDSDPNCVAWLEDLVAADLIGAGRVDGRPVEEVKTREVSGLETSHFFAGIGGWDYALRLAGWPEGRPVWTGSCPCQPFSTAGKRRAHKDRRHVWPHFLRLVAECRPHVVFGEQVAGNLGLEWLAGVRTDLEALGYAVGWCELCAAGVGAPHRRQRLYWCAHAPGRRCRKPARPGQAGQEGPPDSEPGISREHSEGTGGRGGPLPLAESDGRQPRNGRVQRGGQVRRVPGGPGAVGGGGAEFWSGADTVACRDGKTRRIPQSSLLPVADGLPDDLASVWLALAGGYPLTDKKFKGRPALIRGAGNAIVPAVAAKFVRAFLDC